MQEPVFPYDVFLSHSAKDKAVVRPLAERLRADGLKVWFDEWVLKPGDSIPAKIEDGLEHSRVLVLCLSANAFGSDWAQLEAGTFRFRDPLNKVRRFIPLRLDDAPIKGLLAQFLFFDWRPGDREQEYVKLLEACRPGTNLIGEEPGAASSKKAVASEQIRYASAKVLLVGEIGVGKTGLAKRLASGLWEPSDSTAGAWASQWKLPVASREGVEREIWLWDFAGQVDYRLVHQLFMDDTAAVVLVLNPQNENPFEGLGRWDRDLQKAARKPFAKLLAAARIDRGGLVVGADSMKKFMVERGFLGSLHETSAKTGKGCDQLRDAIMQAIDWKSLPETTSPALYRRLKQEILSLRDSGLVLIRLAELKQRMEMTLRNTNFELAELEAVVGLLAGSGMIQPLDFGGFILLRPEVLSRYAAAVVRKVRKHPQELGCIREDELLAGDLDYQDFKRLPREDEAVVLRTLLETFISRAWCLRQPGDGSAMLTFPSYFRRERKEQPRHPNVLVTYRFGGPADDIYATLVVRLHYTVAFQITDLWKSAADFETQSGVKLGFSLTLEGEGTSALDVYFDPTVSPDFRVLFLSYVHDHLCQHAQNVVRMRHYACCNIKCEAFGHRFQDQASIDRALSPSGKGKVFCPDCGTAIELRDMLEEKFTSPEVGKQVRDLRVQSQAVIDNESRELILVGHVMAIAGEAGQIYRGYTNSDHGIDGEIEFKDDQGRASGKRLYLQLKSGDSYLRKRVSDGAEVFQIKNERWAAYWQEQPYHVMLVIHTSDGRIRWMDVSAYLKKTKRSSNTARQIIFSGEPFTAYSLRSYRDKVLHAFHHDEPSHRRPKQLQKEDGPLRVSLLNIANIRGIEGLTLDFSAPAGEVANRRWTILLGENGTGKSTILRSLALLLSGGEGCAQLLGDPATWLRNGCNEGSISVILEARTGRKQEIKLVIQRGMSAVDVVKNNPGLEWLDAAISVSAHNCFIAGYGVTRRPPVSGLVLSQQSSASFVLGARAQAVASLFTPDVVLQPLEEWAIDLHYRQGEEGLDLLREAFRGILPRTQFKAIDKEKKQLLFATVDGDVPLSLLSDGYQNMISWCGDLLYRITQAFDEVTDPFSVAGIMLIDEMDLHLHPVWQRQLISFLSARLPHFQIIATTHSPFTALEAGRGELHLLERRSVDSSPLLRRFDGIPRQMRLEDLAISPWFGLKTGFSLEVEKLRNEYEMQKKVGAQTSQRERPPRGSKYSRLPRKPEVQAKLELLPESDPRTEIEKQNRTLLTKLDAIVGETAGKSKLRRKLSTGPRLKRNK